MWDTRATRICSTLVWFPTKVTMLIASSNELIFAGIRKIAQALHHSSPGSPLAPLTDSLHDELIQLTRVLITVAQPATTPVSPPPSATTIDAPTSTGTQPSAAAGVTALEYPRCPSEGANAPNSWPHQTPCDVRPIDSAVAHDV